MLDVITDKFEKAMKKGFISTLVLMTLDEEPSHGYQIIKKIQNRSFGFWEPNVSTMYTILKDLRIKRLIKLVKEQEMEDPKKIYELTNRGRKALKIMRKKEIMMHESMQQLISETHGDSSLPDFREMFFSRNFSSRLENKSKKEKISLLQSFKSTIEKRIEMLNQRLQSVEEQLSKLENESVE